MAEPAESTYLKAGAAVYRFDLPLNYHAEKQLERGQLAQATEEEWLDFEAERAEARADDTPVSGGRTANKRRGQRQAKKAEPVKVEPLTDDELLAAVDGKVLAAVDAEHDPAEVRAKLAELAAK